MTRRKATILVLAFILGLTACFGASGEDDLDPVWVLCQPDSYVNIRERPNKQSARAGYAECGDRFLTDGKIRNGFLHVYASVEAGEGWIKTGYLVWTEPEKVFETRRIESDGRVNARRTIGGERRCWLKSGEEIKVYWMADWAVTNRGFVKTEYISQEGEKYESAED